jgi:hypothetical protein
MQFHGHMDISNIIERLFKKTIIRRFLGATFIYLWHLLHPSTFPLIRFSDSAV